MNNVFFGKFFHDNPIQIEEKYFAAGAPGGAWYGGIQPGDYVFVVSKGSLVLALWKVREYGSKQNPINPTDPGVVFFDEIRKLEPPVPVTQFIKSPYFDVDINLLNKISKNTKNGFYPLPLTPSFPMEQWGQLSFDKVRRFYVALQSYRPPLAEHDVTVVIDDLQKTNITGFIEWKDGKPQPYTALQKLYEEKNPDKERYSLLELLGYAEQDEAPRKKNYLESVLSDLGKKGYFAVDNPIQLYDNILVGRKKSSSPKTAGSPSAAASDPEADDNERPEYYDDYKKYAELLEFNPNLILYGPPGTGKTYATKNIIEAFEYRHHNQYIPYAQVEQEKRVRFITFHQSYSYEEFIEGIRPQLTDGASETETGGGDIRYQVEPGILKQMEQAASTQLMKEESKLSGIAGADLIRPTSKVWKVSLGRRNDNTEYSRCKKDHCIAVGWLEQYDLTDKSHEEIYDLLEKERDELASKPVKDANSLYNLIAEMNKGDIVFIYDGPETIRDIGVITGDYTYKKGRSYPHVRSVTWLKEYKEPQDISEMNGGTGLTLQTVYRLARIQISDVQKLIGTGSETGTAGSAVGAKTLKANPKPYYLIIDEINRGNISRIFGELMTLIEKDKRSAISTVLPYSKKPFTLPPNLYLIGTMNTADRSIAMLDTALRRRFAFVELEPDYDVFTKHAATVGTVELAPLLRSINTKIAEKLDRDHRIGHAYFMDVLTVDTLYKTWYYKVLPLISEYFYNDVASIQSVVGGKFIDKTGSIRFLDMNAVDGASSEFEKALTAIYKGTGS